MMVAGPARGWLARGDYREISPSPVVVEDLWLKKL